MSPQSFCIECSKEAVNHCTHCGLPMCRDCYKKNNGICQKCSRKMKNAKKTSS